MSKEIQVMEMENAQGTAVNVDPRTVEAVRPMAGAPHLAGLEIGKIVVVVKGDPKKTAKEIGEARGKNCPYREK